MTKILYFDCFSGISGDMTVAALTDAGADPGTIETELKKLKLNTEYRLNWSKVVKKGISAAKFNVETTGESHGHRHYSTIVKMIEQADFSENVKETALRIFKAIGEAESKIHAIPMEKVHFHEVGAVDSIIDIVGTAIALDQIKPDRVVSSSIPVGNGKIVIDHGVYPVPAPATLEILKGIPLQASGIEGEQTTPTGAGIVSAIVQDFGPVPDMRVDAIGYGAGTKDFPEQPNVLRVITGRVDS